MTKLSPGSMAKFAEIAEAFPYWKVLMIGGFFGASVKLMLAPDENWRAWLIQIGAGLATAVFLGGFVGSHLGLQAPGYLATGFILGSGAELIMRLIQRRIAVQIAAAVERKDVDKE